ncbi:3-phosphoshikimate 1-carboxyvinyltransferase [Paenibacillus sp. HWE-109]|uniref:3-phosphoshikimate 1-carboxyvinyltransferase n=1 Tax=Paenibacillus sp. HWE-109 TaxID=1306526 RepID=UPI001EDE07F2|nr:3-phosphoshikimate 1-carboxyvinyltransferase [Paenibacillus sp. HWE-109]UKS25781.1 3-phosphoshikimate 1-carboxyvinyltransferase [Paenibacillus sp. HWE-109]
MVITSSHEPDREARSPWSQHHVEQKVRLSRMQGRLDRTISIPGSKSFTNRALLIAAIGRGTTVLRGVLQSDDSYWCMKALRALGVVIEDEGEHVTIHGNAGKWAVADASLYVGAAGTVARFLPAVLAVGKGEWLIEGSRRMGERPLTALLDALTGLGAVIQYGANPGSVPFTLLADGLSGGEVAISGAVSSQFISGLLLAAPYASEALSIRIEGEVVQRDYVEMTLDMMRAFGVSPEVQDNGQVIIVRPRVYEARSLCLEPDASTCGYFWALAALTNGRIRIEGISAQTRQPDIALLQVLKQMGCTIISGADFVEVQGTDRLKGGFTVSMQRWSDQTLTLAALAPFADGPITLTDAAHIRHHECDRIAAICQELRKLGIEVEEHADGLTVHPGQPQPALLDPHDDHRMAMALSLIGARVDGVQMMDPGCVSKTCPDFYERWRDLGVGVDFDFA